MTPLRPAPIQLAPIRLAPNLIDHYYAGGSRIAALRDLETTSDHQPEEWIASTVSRANAWPVGLSHTLDGTVLRDLVAEDPATWVGADTDGADTDGADTDGADTGGADTHRGDTGLLLKLLDAGQRLPVHVHPDRAFAARHLHCPYGKTEAWFVLAADAGAAVHLGWQEDVDPDELVRRREAQDGDWMLDRLHRVEVHPGDGVVVPAGTAHAIGAGVLVAEAQEPTDLSILLEWSVTTSGRDESHLGLGFETAMAAVSHERMDPANLAALRTHVDPAARAPGLMPCLADAARPFFRLDVAAPVADAVPVPEGFAAAVVLDGRGTLEWGSSGVPLERGQVLAVPAALGGWSIAGDVRVLVARPGETGPGGTS